jgi:hypothetical protein
MEYQDDWEMAYRDDPPTVAFVIVITGVLMYACMKLIHR